MEKRLLILVAVVAIAVVIAIVSYIYILSKPAIVVPPNSTLNHSEYLVYNTYVAANCSKVKISISPTKAQVLNNVSLAQNNKDVCALAALKVWQMVGILSRYNITVDIASLQKSIIGG